MTKVIHVGQYVQYRNKIYKVVETNRLTNTAKVRFADGVISGEIPFDELEEVPF